jgi:hypothetical protein
MRHLEHKTVPEKEAGGALNNLVAALIEELADEVPDNPKLETVRADLLAASHSYETCKKKDLALRFYLAMRSLLREHELLQERLKKAEKRGPSFEGGNSEVHLTSPDRPENVAEAYALESVSDPI